MQIELLPSANPAYSSLTVIAASCILIAGCNTTPPPNQCVLGQSANVLATDGSPPRAVVDVFLAGGKVVSVTGSSGGSVVITQPNGRITLVAKATDPEGPKDIQIWMETTTCTSNAGGTFTCSGPGLAGRPDASNRSTAQVGTEVCSERIVSLNVDVVNTQVRRISHRVSVVAENFGGLKHQVANIELVAQ